MATFVKNEGVESTVTVTFSEDEIRNLENGLLELINSYDEASKGDLSKLSMPRIASEVPGVYYRLHQDFSEFVSNNLSQ